MASHQKLLLSHYVQRKRTSAAFTENDFREKEWQVSPKILEDFRLKSAGRIPAKVAVARWAVKANTSKRLIVVFYSVRNRSQ